METPTTIKTDGQVGYLDITEEDLQVYNERKKEQKEKNELERLKVMEADLLRPLQKISYAGKIWIAFLAVLCIAGIYAYYIQETRSKYLTVALRDYTMWGVYISSFVFYVALSIVGVLMSAILKVLNFEWGRPLTRLAEVIAAGAIIMGGLCIMAAMGRPDRLHYLLIYGRIQSPITWDVIVVVTEIAACCLLVLVPLVPGMNVCRNSLVNIPKWQMWIYKTFSFGWNGSPEQWKVIHKSVTLLAYMAIPLGIAVQTVNAYLFATTLRPEWDSTNFGPYFVSGAFLLGAAAMIIAVAAFRKFYHFEKYLTEKHFDYMGRMLVFLSICYTYCNVNEFLVPSFKMNSMQANRLLDLFVGHTAPLYWMVAVFGFIIPATLPFMKSMRKPVPLTIIAITTVIAAWLKRYLIVIPGLTHPLLPIQDVPSSWLHYSPSIVEMTIVTATFAGLLLMVTLFSRLFPLICVWEVADGEKIKMEKLHHSVKSVLYENAVHSNGAAHSNGKGNVVVKTVIALLISLSAIQFANAKQAIKLSFVDNDSIKYCKAIVTVNDTGRARGVGVRFFSKRFFGMLPIASLQKTDDNGEVSVPFPKTLPGDTLGNVNITARLDDDEDVLAEATVPWGVKVVYDNKINQRTWWASRSNAPTYLIIASNLIIAAIWGVMIYVTYLIVFRLKKVGVGYKPDNNI